MIIKGVAKTGQFTMALQQLLYEMKSTQDAVLSPRNVLSALSRELVKLSSYMNIIYC